MKGPIEKTYHKCISRKLYKSSVTEELTKIGSLTDIAIANVLHIISSGYMTEPFIRNERSAILDCLAKLQGYCEMLQPRKESENAPEKNIFCNLCSKVFFFSEKTHHFKRANSVKLKCDYPGCNSTARTQKTLDIHKKIHTKPEEELFKCKKCHKLFLFKSDLLTRMCSHSNIHYYQCTLCDKTVKHAGLLTRHSQTCGLSVEFYMCIFVDCDYSNQDVDKTNSHIKFTHQNSDQFLCKKCRDLFEFKENYIDHKKHVKGINENVTE